MIPNDCAYNDCRGMLRHSWHEVDSVWAHEGDGTPFTIRCERCGTERRDVLGTNTGEVVSRRYVYPVGYHIEGENRPKIVDFRLSWLSDHLEQMRERRQDRGAK